MVDRMRCPWCGDDPLYVRYHDEEWGVPVLKDRRLFEFLLLEGAQAGLSWRTILGRRPGYRAAFEDFDPARVARLSRARCEELRQDPSIIRNRLKIESAVTNARAFLAIQDERGSFSDYLWAFVDGTPIQSARRRLSEVPSETPLSREISRDLKSRGFRFVGPTIIYAFMQAVGLVNDHLVGCYRWKELGGGARG